MPETIDYSDYGFSPAVRANGLLFCSGQIGIDSNGKVPEDPSTQYALVFAALDQLLKNNGCKVTDLVDLTTFHTHYPEHMDIFMQEKAKFLGNALPTWTAVGVAALGYPQSLVEIKAIAAIPV